MKRDKRCTRLTRNLLAAWILGAVLAAIPGISAAATDVAALIAGGMNPTAAVEQAIADGEDPVGVASAAAAAAPGAAYEVALAVAKAAPEKSQEITAAILTAAPSASQNVVEAVVKAAPDAEEGIVKVVIQTDQETGKEIVTVNILADRNDSGDQGVEIIVQDERSGRDDQGNDDPGETPDKPQKPEKPVVDEDDPSDT